MKCNIKELLIHNVIPIYASFHLNLLNLLSSPLGEPGCEVYSFLRLIYVVVDLNKTFLPVNTVAEMSDFP